MKKNNFLEGAMIATIGIVLCKIIGLVYVIPFYSIIGDQGGTLYGYAYSIYAIFLSLSSTGIPVALSKLISEYNTLEYHYTKEKTFRLGSYIIIGLGFLSFVILELFAPQIAHMILGDLEGGNTIEGVSMVIRVVATALLIVPLLSVTRGYLQGHKMMAPPSISNVIEQLVRVIIIVLGSFLALKVFHLSLETAVGIAVFAATIGAIASYFYLYEKIKKNKDKLKRKEPMTREETRITTKDILKKILFYAFPFIAIDLVKSAYSMVDTFTVVKALDHLGYTAAEAELAIGVISTWASKLNMIVISISLGISISLIPNLASSFIKKDMNDVSKKVNQSLQALFLVALPMTLGLFFLARPTWTIFYGYNPVSIEIFQFYVFQTLTFSFYPLLIDMAQTMNDTKLALGTLFGSFLAKALLNTPIMYLCQMIGIKAYQGATIATLLTQMIPIIIILIVLRKKYQVRYGKTFRIFLKTGLCTAIMMITLMILKLFIPLAATTKMGAVIEVVIFAGVGGLLYLFLAYKSKLLSSVFGKQFIEDILVKFHLKKPKLEH